MRNDFKKVGIQLVAMLAAALISEYVVCWLHRMYPSITHMLVSAASWLAAGLAYLIPRSVAQSFGARILGSFLILTAFAAVRILLVWLLKFPMPFIAIIAPSPAILVFCVAAFLILPQRSSSAIAAVVCPTVLVQFACMWWLYDFQTGYLLTLTFIQLVPYVAAISVLIVTDNLIKIEDNPTNHSSGTREPAAGSLDAQ